VLGDALPAAATGTFYGLTKERTVRRLGYIEVTYELLRDALGIPPDHKIESVWYDMENFYAHTFKIVVSGPQMPGTAEGSIIPRMMMRVNDTSVVYFEEV